MWFYIFVTVVVLALAPAAIEHALILVHLLVVAVTRIFLYVAIAGGVALAFALVHAI